MDYTDDMCQKTLDILSRTACVMIDPEWTENQVMERVKACRKAARNQGLGVGG